MRECEIPTCDGGRIAARLDLEFPVGETPPRPESRMSLDALIRWNEERLLFFNASGETQEERLRSKCPVPFVL